MSAISIQNLSKTYPPSFPRLKKFFRLPLQPAVEALTDVSFDISEGEIFGLIGKNGAGKTTLTKIIATLVQPTDGQVSVKDFDSVKDEVKVRSLIGLATAEERSFYWRLTAIHEGHEVFTKVLFDGFCLIVLIRSLSFNGQKFIEMRALLRVFFVSLRG